MCFAVDNKLQKWIVIDGLQRISSIIRFLKGENWVLSQLEDIDPSLAGQSVATIFQPNSPLHKFYTRVENLAIPVTMLRCDFSKEKHLDYLFTIFHRLNTGSMKLNNQEIRNFIFSGNLNNLLKKLDKKPNWRKLNKMKDKENLRFTKQELILRFFAFDDGYNDYNSKLAKFLKDYMRKNKNPSQTFLEKKEVVFDQTTNLIYEKMFHKKAPKKTIINSYGVNDCWCFSKSRNPFAKNCSRT